jgi:hypothetical protein
MQNHPGTQADLLAIATCPFDSPPDRQRPAGKSSLPQWRAGFNRNFAARLTFSAGQTG